MLAPGGIWTHTVRAGEAAITLRVSAHRKNAYGLYLTGKRSIFLYLHLKMLAPGGIWTHTVRAGEGATTLRVSAHSKNAYGLIWTHHEVTTICHTNNICHTKRHMVYIWPEKNVFYYTYTWKSWHLVGFEPTLFGRAKVQPHYAYQPTCQVRQVWWCQC